MAKNTVVIKLDPLKIYKKEGGHLIYSEDMMMYRYGMYIKIESTSAESVKRNTSDFVIPLILPSNCEIVNIRIPMEIYNTSSKEYSNCSLGVENSSFTELSSDGNLRDNTIVNQLNSYKLQHGTFPQLILRVTSRAVKSNDYTAFSRVILYAPAVTCKINGSQTVYRPTADVSTGHSIPTGFSKIYDLIDETTSDESVTCISSVSENQTSIVNETSVVKTSKINYTSPVYQIRLLASIAMTEEDASCIAEVQGAISFNGKKSYFYQNKPTESSICNRWKNNQYYTFEKIIPSNSELIKEINSYYSQNKNSQSFEITLKTYAQGYKESDKGTSYKAIAEISQVYLEVICTEGINVYKKVDGNYKEVAAAYKKTNGTWIEIEESECKEILKSSRILTG